ncbi:hypothetical protein RQM47_13940 [Rubrivirga sp. S365]|uniref:hypothetical protein n=1 Tax=Rubrivirga sp. S365 TaxID=3076080 RepID=UPI0028C86FC6|nr:hypothetical protein [Rubrivirga sp. S365]MDT7857748.1 hypothetical protein [Rubrivirga sp. S365]
MPDPHAGSSTRTDASRERNPASVARASFRFRVATAFVVASSASFTSRFAVARAPSHSARSGSRTAGPTSRST